MKSLQTLVVMLFFACSCHLAFPKVLFLATHAAFIPDTGVSINLFVKVGDLFSLAKAKKHPCSSKNAYLFIYDF